MTSITADERWEQWHEWFAVAFTDVQTLAHHRHVWRNLLALLASNPDIQHHSIMNDWLVRGYSQTLAVGVRRQSEYDTRRPTIARILKELAANPTACTRERYLADSTDNPLDTESWELVAGRGALVLDPEMAQRDLDQLVLAAVPCRTWVNRAVAHRGRDRIEDAIKYSVDDFNAGLDALCELIRRYWPLFHPGNSLYRVTPDLDLSWTSMFDVAWRSEAFVPVPTDGLG